MCAVIPPTSGAPATVAKAARVTRSAEGLVTIASA